MQHNLNTGDMRTHTHIHRTSAMSGECLRPYMSSGAARRNRPLTHNTMNTLGRNYICMMPPLKGNAGCTPNATNRFRGSAQGIPQKPTRLEFDAISHNRRHCDAKFQRIPLRPNIEYNEDTMSRTCEIPSAKGTRFVSVALISSPTPEQYEGKCGSTHGVQPSTEGLTSSATCCIIPPDVTGARRCQSIHSPIPV